MPYGVIKPQREESIKCQRACHRFMTNNNGDFVLARGRGISSHGIDPVIPGFVAFGPRWLTHVHRGFEKGHDILETTFTHIFLWIKYFVVCCCCGSYIYQLVNGDRQADVLAIHIFKLTPNKHWNIPRHHGTISNIQLAVHSRIGIYNWISFQVANTKRNDRYKFHEHVPKICLFSTCMIYAGLSKIKLIQLVPWFGSDHLIIVYHFERRKRTWTRVTKYCHVPEAMIWSLTKCELFSKESPMLSSSILMVGSKNIRQCHTHVRCSTQTGNLYRQQIPNNQGTSKLYSGVSSQLLP